MGHTDRVPPTAHVVGAFGLHGVPAPLTGGMGVSFRVAGTVLKRVDDPEEAAWCAELLETVVEDGFRIARPLRSRDGRLVVDGWTASDFVAGQPGPPDWSQLMPASRAFHSAVAEVPPPDFLSRRRHRWAHADRVAWGEANVTPVAGLEESLRRLRTIVQPVSARDQLVHADLSGNLLYHPDLPPAVIDFSPSYRPVAYAEAVAVVDGLLWHGVGADVIALLEPANADQMLVRAAIFRLVAASELARERGERSHGDAAALRWLATLLEGRVSGS